MTRKTKIIIAVTLLLILSSIVLYIKMKGFANGVNEDAKKKKDFSDKKLNDSTTAKFKEVK